MILNGFLLYLTNARNMFRIQNINLLPLFQYQNVQIGSNELFSSRHLRLSGSLTILFFMRETSTELLHQLLAGSYAHQIVFCTIINRSHVWGSSQPSGHFSPYHIDIGLTSVTLLVLRPHPIRESICMKSDPCLSYLLTYENQSC